MFGPDLDLPPLALHGDLPLREPPPAAALKPSADQPTCTACAALVRLGAPFTAGN
jgi:hypothetical protein